LNGILAGVSNPGQCGLDQVVPQSGMREDQINPKPKICDRPGGGTS